MSHPEPVANVSTSTWPEETELCFAPGGTRVMLTIQCWLVHIVIQDSIDILQAMLIFWKCVPGRSSVSSICLLRSCFSGWETTPCHIVHSHPAPPRQRLHCEDHSFGKCLLPYNERLADFFKDACSNPSFLQWGERALRYNHAASVLGYDINSAS